jgi:hypothetical protein
MYVYRNPHARNYETAREQLAAVEAEERQLTERMAWIAQRKAELTSYLHATGKMIENDPGQFLANAGLSQVCKIALDKAPGWVTAQQVRDILWNLGIDLKGGYTNPMAVLHATLKRVGQTWTDGKDTYYAKKGTAIPISPWAV